MQTPLFTKRNYLPFVALLVFSLVLGVVAAVWTHYYFGVATGNGTPDERLGAFTLGREVTLRSLLDSCDYAYDWAYSPLVRVQVLAEEDGEEYEQEGLLTYDATEQTLKAVGVGKGTLRIYGAWDDTLEWRIRFETEFASTDTADILASKDNHPEFFEDGIVTADELARITRVRLDNAVRVDFADFASFIGLERLELRNSADIHADTTVVALNLRLRDETSIYVGYGQYLSYTADPAWQTLADKIFPLIEGDDKLSVLLHAGEGKFADQNNVFTVPVRAGEKAVLDAYTPTRRGYAFAYWSRDGETEADMTGVLYRNVKLYAVYTPVRYTAILHDTVDASVTEKRTLTFGEDVAVGEEIFADRDEYYFLGWAYAQDAEEPDLPAGMPLRDLADTEGAQIELYAVWIYETFTVRFSSEGNIIQSALYRLGDMVVVPASPTSDAGEFSGWAHTPDATQADYTGKDAIEGLYAPLATRGVVTLYALFDPELYTVIYSAPAADVIAAPSPQEHCRRDASLTLAGMPERLGYRFAGWKAPNGTVYAARGVLPHGLPAATSTITLQATWACNSFGIAFSANNGDSMYRNTTARYDGDVTFSGSPSRTGYSLGYIDFVGANLRIKRNYLTADEVRTLYRALLRVQGCTNNTFPSGNVHIYGTAEWVANKYTLTINTSHASVKIKDAYNKEYRSGNLVPYDTYLSYTCSADSGYKNPKLSGHGGEENASGSFHMPAGDLTVTVSATENPPCVASGTLVRMADGTVRPVETLSVGDAVLGWDLRNGTFAPTQIVVLTAHGVRDYTVLTMTFADGQEVRIIDRHVFYDVTSKAFVTVTEENYAAFIGHDFACRDPETGEVAYTALCGVASETVCTGSFSIVTAAHYTSITDDVISASADICGFYELLSDWMTDGKIDVARARADIETYGLYTYEEYADYLTREQFDALNAAYYRVAVGKGYATEEEILAMLLRYAEWL